MSKVTRLKEYPRKHASTKKVIAKDSPIHGKGLFAKEKIKRGEVICIIKGPIFHKINRTKEESLKPEEADWVGIKRHHWVDPILPYKRLNHSCNPNARVKGSKTLVAKREIKAGDEITFDYSLTEIDPFWEMHSCQCNEKECRKIITAMTRLEPKIVKKLLPHTGKAIKREFMRYTKNSDK